MTQKEMLTTAQALKRYRHNAPPELLARVREFNKMGINDRIELLFFMTLQAVSPKREMTDDPKDDHDSGPQA